MKEKIERGGENMKINWKLRLKNKTTLTAIVVSIVSLVYQVLGLFNIVPSISENEIINICGMVINLLVLLGIVVDPTTSGIEDSNRAMNYEVPNDGRYDEC